MKLATVMFVIGCGDPTTTPPDAVIDSPAGWTTEYQDPLVELNAVWGSGPNDVYAVGKRGIATVILHSTGNGQWVEQQGRVNAFLLTVWGSGPSDIYAGGSGNALLHSTGDGVWTPQTIPDIGVMQVWGSGPSDIYFTFPNSGGVVYHSTGNGTWTPITIGDGTSVISAMWGTSSSDIRFAGGIGTNYRTPYVVHGPTNPMTETMPALPDAYLRNIFKIWGSSSSDFYAVGNGPSIYHSDGGGTWTLQSGPTGGGTLLDVWGSGPNDIYIVGQDVGVRHSMGNGTWSVDADVHNQPKGVWGSSAADVYVVGAERIVHKRAAQ